MPTEVEKLASNCGLAGISISLPGHRIERLEPRGETRDGHLIVRPPSAFLSARQIAETVDVKSAAAVPRRPASLPARNRPSSDDWHCNVHVPLFPRHAQTPRASDRRVAACEHL